MLTYIFSLVNKLFIRNKKPLQRSKYWDNLRKRIIRKSPICAICGKTTDLDVHHIKPFHLCPELELEPSNCVVLCRTDHLIFGHLYNWQSYNVDIIRDIEIWKDKIKFRPKSE